MVENLRAPDSRTESFLIGLGDLESFCGLFIHLCFSLKVIFRYCCCELSLPSSITKRSQLVQTIYDVHPRSFKKSVSLFHSLSSNLQPSLLNMTDLAFEVEPPSPDSDDALLHVIEYVRLPAMLELFEEQAGFSLGSSILPSGTHAT